MDPKTKKPSAPPADGAAVGDVQHQDPGALNQDAPPATPPSVQDQDRRPDHQDPPPPEPDKRVYLTTAPSDAFGAQGRFADLTPEEAAGHPEGLLVEPTPEQLARRRS